MVFCLESPYFFFLFILLETKWIKILKIKISQDLGQVNIIAKQVGGMMKAY